MINTKCSQCLFASNTSVINDRCSKNIIPKIQDIKTITFDDDNFAIIENYACKFGFSKEVYESNQHLFDEDKFQELMTKNSTIKLYLILDIHDIDNISHISDQLNQLPIKPQYISLLLRDPTSQKFTEDTANVLNDKLKGCMWKAHSFLENISLIDSIDHILATNIRANNTTHFLVYDSDDIGSLSKSINYINDIIMLYQKPHIAILNNKTTLYGLAISFENYKVAKSLQDNFFHAITQESSLLFY